MAGGELMNFYWYRCPKCAHTISTPSERLEVWCIQCGRRMTQPEQPQQETPTVDTPLFGKAQREQ
jgi:DNA-directed RNA polymerase subunit RPC12/RpoP